MAVPLLRHVGGGQPCAEQSAVQSMKVYPSETLCHAAERLKGIFGQLLPQQLLLHRALVGIRDAVADVLAQLFIGLLIVFIVQIFHFLAYPVGIALLLLQPRQLLQQPFPQQLDAVGQPDMSVITVEALGDGFPRNDDVAAELEAAELHPGMEQAEGIALDPIQEAPRSFCS